MDKKDKCWQLFLSTFKLSACTFGGGFVIIPLMRERFVKELHWIEEEEMLDLTAIAQSSPGSIAINASILVGYHVAGIPGVCGDSDYSGMRGQSRPKCAAFFANFPA